MEKKEYHAPTKCPVCGDAMEVTKVKCKNCSSELSGSFSLCRFCTLSEKHLQFIEVFLRCRGSIKEVEKVMGISYPTVRNLLDASLTELGLNEKTQTDSQAEEKKAEILEKLAKKEIDVEAAIQALNEVKGGK
jgi:Uncharacterized protein conserved in bacteria